jgi:hypothetical protein
VVGELVIKGALGGERLDELQADFTLLVLPRKECRWQKPSEINQRI